ncbi:hypothetical protein HQ487_05360 [Candidatus Uhrbacteria bacterium]|nr:hypothetical protein [Candidatus Uhrbacteria bacterium]
MRFPYLVLYFVSLIGFIVGCAMPELPQKKDGSDTQLDTALDIDSDSNSDSEVDDADGDGYSVDDDCDDTDPTIFPGAEEICNEIDDNCDGQVDEGVTTTWYADLDGDGYGTMDMVLEACESSSLFVDNTDDCDDTDADVYPGAVEVCNDLDDDCDGDVDEGVTTTWYADQDSDGYGGSAIEAEGCEALVGFVDNTDDCDDTDPSVNPGVAEVCGNGIDDNCDSSDDDATGSVWYRDGDGDGYGAYATQIACTQPSGYVLSSTDCDDTDAQVNPGATEVCDGADNDCDGSTDPDTSADASTWYIDADGDGYGYRNQDRVSCTQPSGYVTSRIDCDDGDADVYPGAPEYCNGYDDDCDAFTDEDAVDGSLWYRDSDADGYGDANNTQMACTRPSGYQSFDSDCDDTDSAVHPMATERCNGYDDNCNGQIDEGTTSTWYADSDGDTYGDPNVSQTACTRPSGYVTSRTDCDDTDPTTYPGATELCDGADNDCDGLQDEGFPDNDGDGYASCEDCDDNDASVNPDGVEYDFDLDINSSGYHLLQDNCSDGLDNDCNGFTDGADHAYCGDDDSDSILNGADAHMVVGTDLCLIAENLIGPDWSGVSIYVQGNGAVNRLSASTAVPLTYITVGGVSTPAWCIAPNGSGYSYGFPVSSVGTDGVSLVNVNDCSDWVRPDVAVCNTIGGSGFCAASGDSDGCGGTPGNTGYGYNFSGGVMLPY